MLGNNNVSYINIRMELCVCIIYRWVWLFYNISLDHFNELHYTLFNGERKVTKWNLPVNIAECIYINTAAIKVISVLPLFEDLFSFSFYITFLTENLSLKATFLQSFFFFIHRRTLEIFFRHAVFRFLWIFVSQFFKIRP